MRKGSLFDKDTLEDCSYMAMAVEEEIKDIRESLENNYPSSIELRCSQEEYLDRLIAVKKDIDWLVDNIAIIISYD